MMEQEYNYLSPINAIITFRISPVVGSSFPKTHHELDLSVKIAIRTLPGRVSRG